MATMFSDTLDNKKFNIDLLEEGKFLNFSWNNKSPEMSLYIDGKKVGSFFFDNELFMKHYILMYFDEDLFLKETAEKGIAKGLYKTEHKIEHIKSQEYMNKNFNMHMEDMNENSLTIICDRDDYNEPYKLHLNDYVVDVDTIILRRIRFCVGYLETAQYNYEKQNLNN